MAKGKLGDVEIPKSLRLAIKAIPRKHLEGIARLDPDEVDEIISDVCEQFLSMRSDDGNPVVIINFDDNGEVKRLTAVGAWQPLENKIRELFPDEPKILPRPTDIEIDDGQAGT